MLTLASVKSGLCWCNAKCGLRNEELITNMSYFSGCLCMRLLVKEDRMAVGVKSARSEDVNNSLCIIGYNRPTLCTDYTRQQELGT
jgi:hypothetical protein